MMVVVVQIGGHSPGEPGKVGNLRLVGEKKEKSVEMCSCMWSITTSIVLDTKYARKEFFTI